MLDIEFDYIKAVEKLKNSNCFLFAKLKKRANTIVKRIHEHLVILETDKYYMQDILDYVIDFCTSEKNSPLLKRATDKQLQEYQKIFSNTLNTVYDDFKPYKIIESNSYIVCSFYYKNEPQDFAFETELSDKQINTIANNKTGNRRTVKEQRFYENNMIYIIKPKQYCFWLKSIAVRDVNEVFTDFIKSGL